MPSCVIAVLFEYATLNGGERSMLSVLDWLRQNEPRFTFVAIAPAAGRLADALREREIPVERWKTHDDQGLRLSSTVVESQLRECVRSIGPRLLHANSLAMGRLTGRLAAELGIPTTTHLRDIIKLSRATVADLNCNSKLVAVSKATSMFHANQGILADRTTVIHNGVDLERFQPRSRSGRLLAELGISNNGPVVESHKSSVKIVATIGQIGLRKGQDILAKAARSIVARIPNVHFVLIGERNSQKQESIEFELALRTLFDQAGLSDRLHLLGYRNDVAELMSEFDLLVHPANQEPFGRVLLEASAVGVPIVATNVGGTSEIVVDGKTGILVAPGRPDDLANAIVDVLSNESKANEFRTAARARACQEFPVSLAATRLAQLWDELAN